MVKAVNLAIKELNLGSYRQWPGSHWQVTIRNYLKGSANLTVHCKSKDDDLGEHVIEFRGRYEWKFKENFWQTTLFWCNFKSMYGHASGEVFWPEKSDWLAYRCDFSNCIWVARGDQGIYLAHVPQRTFELKYRWQK
ncbi:S-protein homolog 1-like [Momordica charantia]|uniref:S-protein homolog n=1 Tax=Momordica charantia TaxID=3673 RepID=A0A6J1C659_MOMCH|nr:S-protein homolog 1-like [Momordica charantia]